MESRSPVWYSTNRELKQGPEKMKGLCPPLSGHGESGRASASGSKETKEKQIERGRRQRAYGSHDSPSIVIRSEEHLSHLARNERNRKGNAERESETERQRERKY